MVSRKDGNDSFHYAQRLAVLKYFPAGPAACGQIAVIIDEICATEDQAEWLVRELIENCDEWPGPAAMRAVHRNKFHPPPELRDDQPNYRHVNLGKRCDLCQGWGCRQEQNGRWVECSCGFWRDTPREQVESVLRMRNGKYGRAWARFLDKPADPHEKRKVTRPAAMEYLKHD